MWWTSNMTRVDVPSTLSRQVWDANTARALPGVGRALAVYSGLISGCLLRLAKAGELEDARPRLLQRPDPDTARPTFVGVHVEDYLLHGNATHLVTARDAYGYPAAVRWYPAHRWFIIEDERDGQPIYHLDGEPVNRGNVVHVQRGADPVFPWRGVGVVEQHVRALDRAGLEEAAESINLTERGRPDIAIITPQSEPAATDLDAAADKWVERFTGSGRKPVFFPKDTQVVPLSWNPKDAQMVEARRMSLQDIANLFNLDGYWLGAGAPSHTYRSPGAMFLAMLKISLNPVMDVFEDVWSQAWYPRGTEVKFDRAGLLQDDLGTMVQAFAVGRQFFPDPNEPRRYMGFPALPDETWEEWGIGPTDADPAILEPVEEPPPAPTEPETPAPEEDDAA